MGERKRNPNRKLAGLTPEQLEAVFRFTESHTLEVSAKWLEAEFGVDMSPQQLGKWAEDERTQRAFEARLLKIAQASKQAGALKKRLGSLEEVTDANLSLLAQAFMAAQLTGSQADVKKLAFQFSMLLDAVAKSRRAGAAVRDSETARQKFEFDAAKAVLKHMAELKAITSDSDLSEEERTRRIRERVFGVQPVEVKK
jgi:hypothetical protein